MKFTPFAAGIAAAALASTGLLASATAADEPGDKPQPPKALVEGLLSPLSLAVADNGTLFYSENFKGTLLRKRAGKAPRPIYQADEGTEVGAVSENDGTLRFATTLPEGSGARLMGITKSGRTRMLGELGTFEENRNPDADVRYGFRRLPDGCEVSEDFAYTGIVESHPYATEQSRGRTYVADAAGNSIVQLGRNGRLSTLAVLPAVPAVVTSQLADMFGLPECTVGERYFFEPVPTDVEEGPDGRLYVSSLPGGPEDGSTGALAGVYRINQYSGKVRKIASGMVSAVGLDVGNKGNIFVSELFTGEISKIKPGGEPTTYVETGLPGDLELHYGDIFATTNVLTGLSGEEGDVPAGQVVRIRR